MGWWWNQSAQPRAQAPPAQAVLKSAPAPSSFVNEALNDLNPDPPQTKPLSRDELADQELATWLQQLSQSSDPISPPTSPSNSSDSSNQFPSDTDSTASSNLYPTTLSCQSAFNYAMRCQSLGGQFTNVYRYGTWRSCSANWQEFWFCMRTRQWERGKREEAVVDHFRRKAVKYKTGPSSEDIWRGRERVLGVEDGLAGEGEGAFRGDYEGLEREWEEWKRRNPGKKEEWEV